MKKLLIPVLLMGVTFSVQANDLPKECLEYISVVSDKVMNESIEQAKAFSKQEGQEFSESQKRILENHLKNRLEQYKQEQTEMLLNALKSMDVKEVAKICKEDLKALTDEQDFLELKR